MNVNSMVQLSTSPDTCTRRTS